MKAPKNTQELKTFLLDQMVAVAEGKQDVSQAKAVCNYVQQVYNVSNLEIKHASMVAKHGNAVKAVDLTGGEHVD